ncbi:MAG: DUF2510 domain-containing protein [Homoserinimonas sp.]|nr:DUF2510 domain-containing protein [Homoserinimonas sp.]MCW5945155.1 DUF2510 domain-containing protein [Cryobacterium sp.]
MDDNNFYGAPAGWYPDPLGLPQLRWWDSTAWTHQTAEARAPMVMQETTYAWADDEPRSMDLEDDDAPTRRERREKERRDRAETSLPTALTLLQLEPPSKSDVQSGVPSPGSGSAEGGFASAPAFGASPSSSPDSSVGNPPDPSGFGQTGYSGQPPTSQPAFSGTQYGSGTQDDSVFQGFSGFAPQQSQQPQQSFDWAPRVDPLSDPQYQAYLRAQTAPHAKPTHNGAVWTIALIPLLQLVLSLLVLTAFGTSEPSAIMAAIWLAPYPITVLLAAMDRNTLRKVGHEKTAHWLWAFAGAPIYLVVRAVAAIRESGGGFGPVLVWLGLGLLQIGAIVAVPGLLISSVPALFASQAEQSIASDAAVIGAQLNVFCPKEPPVFIGQTFECLGMNAAGKGMNIEVSLQRVNGWIDWQVTDWGIYTIG